MKLSLNQEKSISTKIWWLFVVAVLSLVGTLSIVYVELHNVIETIDETRRLRAITDELGLLGENLIDAETGQRGYLITQDPAYLQPYHASTAHIHQRLSKLKQLITDPVSQAHLEQMLPIIEGRIAVASEAIALRQNNQLDAAITMVKSGKGKQLMDAFRQLRAQMLQRELSKLNAHKKQYETDLFYVLVTLIVGGLLAIIVMLISAVTISRTLKKPIMNLLEGIHAMAEGRADYQVIVTEQDEIGRISVAFNEMAEHMIESRKVKEDMMADLQRSNADLDKFAYVASHDLKAPLRGIRSLAQWIEEDVRATASAETLENLSLLNNRVDRLDGLLESLLAYSRIGYKTSVPETIDLAKLIADIADYLAPGAGFSVLYQGDIANVNTSKSPLELVLRNLINNAVKHHDQPQGQVIITAQDIGRHIEYRVQDDGPGIPEAFHTRIFEMFQTLKPRDQVEGSGMGLAIVKKTVELFGGDIRVVSNAGKRGTTFIFSWKK